MRRLVSLLLALATVLCLLAGCGKNTAEEETTTVPEEATAAIAPDSVVAELGEDGTVNLISNIDGSAETVIGSDGNNAEAADPTTFAPEVTSTTALNGDVTTTKAAKVVSTTSTVTTTDKPTNASILERADVKAILEDTGKTAIQIADAIKNKGNFSPEEKAYIINSLTSLTDDQKAKLLNEVAVGSYPYKKDGYFYTDDNEPWRRILNYNEFYDLASNCVAIHYDTVRVEFNHNKKDWIIQMWKGQYSYLFLGSEIGLYTKDPKDSSDHYNRADVNNILNMSMTLYRVNRLTGAHTQLFSKDFGPHWWISGFTPGILTSMSDRSELIMTGSIKFKGSQMAKKFANGLAEAGFKNGSPSHNNVDTYSVSGSLVSFSWRYKDQGLGRVKMSDNSDF